MLIQLQTDISPDTLCPWPFTVSDLGLLSLLAEQYLVCVFNFISMTLRPLWLFNFRQTSTLTHSVHGHLLFLTLTYFSLLAEQY